MSPNKPVIFNSKDEDAAKSKIARANRFNSSTCDDVLCGIEDDGIEISLELVDIDAADIL
jgi:hypothetical protein